MTQPRSFASSTITFAMLDIPVKLYLAADREKSVSLSWLHKDCGAKLEQNLSCPAHGALSKEEMQKGFEFSRDQYLALTDDEVEQLKGDDPPRITILGTLLWDQVPRIALERTYFLAPDKGGDEGLAVLVAALDRRRFVAFAESVIRGQKSIALLAPLGELLVMHHLFYASEVRTPPELEKHTTPATADVRLAQRLIEALRLDKFDHADYVDASKARMRELLERKARGERIVLEHRNAPPARVLDIRTALERSLEATSTVGTKRRKAG